MSTLTSVPNPLDRIANDPYWLRQFTVAEYHKMVQAGILGPDHRVELLEGWIVNKTSQNPPHASSVTRVLRRIGRILPETWTLRVQAPITLSVSESEPEPDLTIARGNEAVYDTRHPRPADIGLLIEVGDSTVLDDRRYKGILYARENILEFWLINIPARKLEFHAQPQGGEYSKKIEYSESESVPLILDGVRIADIPVSELIAKS